MADETRVIKIEIDTGPVEHAAISIKSLTDANKKLREERKLLDVTTKEGQHAIEAINKSLDHNNSLIKQNSSSLEKHRLNVGNYTESIEKAIPALEEMTGGAVASAEGIGHMTKSAMAFLATPLGAVLGAIGIAFAALIEYFKGSEEGQDRLNKIMAVGKVVIERFKDVLEAIGKALFEAPGKMDKFSTAIKIAFFPITAAVASVKALAEVFARFFPETSAAIKKYFNDITADAARLSELEEEITKKEREQIEARAENALRIAKLRQAADESTGQARLDLITQAIAIAEEQSKSEVDLAKLKRDFAADELRVNGDTIEAKHKLAEANAEVFNQETAFLTETRKNNKERVALIDQLNAATAARAELMKSLGTQQIIDEKAQLDEEAQLRAADHTDDITQEGLTNEQKMAMSKQVLGEKSTDAEAYTLKTSIENQKQLEIDAIANASRRDAQFAVASQGSAFLKQMAGKHKGLAIASAVIDTYVGAAKAIATYAEFPPLAAAMAAIIVAMGIANVAKIAGVQFASGGYTGQGAKYQPAGIVHSNEFVVPSESVNKYGVGHFNQYLPGYADGGLVTNQAVAATNEQAAISSAVRMLTNISISWREGLLVDDRIKFKEALTTK